jgi:hypothetical protein
MSAPGEADEVDDGIHTAIDATDPPYRCAYMLAQSPILGLDVKYNQRL